VVWRGALAATSCGMILKIINAHCYQLLEDDLATHISVNLPTVTIVTTPNRTNLTIHNS